jgi:lysophospholipase L1-like esterase
MMLTDLGLRTDIALSTHALSRRHLFRAAIIAIGLSFASAQVGPVYAADPQKWAASWTASAHGPFPSGNAVAQPDLSFAFPTPQANDQTFRLIVRPNLWSKQFRLRFSNVFGAQPVTFDDVFLGLQRSAGAIVADSNRLVQFGGQRSVTVAPGTFVYSDPIRLEYVDDEEKFYLDGRKLAVSFHVVGTSGPMTWHAKALQTSYVTLPGAGSHSEDESDQAFPNSTTSWYFLDVVDAMAPADTAVIVAFGDSITDGTASTLNGDDRWPDVVSRRMHAAYGNHVSVVNEGIGGNQVVGPAVYSPQMPVSGGPSAISRLDRDVLSLSGVSGVIWLEGINDLGAGTLADSVTGGIKQVVGTLHHRGIKVIQATITSSVGNTGADGNPSVNAARQVINSFIRTAGIFDGVADFDAVTVDPATGAIKAQFLVNSTLGTIDHLHPNRAGYLAMGNAVDIGIFAPRHIAKR